MSCVLCVLVSLLSQDLKSRVDALVEKLSDSSIETREEAAKELKSLWKDERVAGWLDAAAAPEARAVADWIRVRRAAPDTLVAKHSRLVEEWLAADDEARLDLLERLWNASANDDARAFIRRTTTAALAGRLGAVGKQRLVSLLDVAGLADHPAVAALLDDASLDVAVRCAQALAKANREVARLLTDSRLDVRVWAIVEAPATRENVDRIAALLPDREPRVRAAAAARLGSENASAHADAIAALLPDRDRGVREHAIRAIGLMRADRHADAVAAQLAGSDVLLQHASLYALGRLRAKAHAAKVAPFLDGEWQHHAVEAARALGAMNAREHEPELRKLLKREPEVARAAAIVLARWGDRNAAALLVSQLRNLELDDRREASVALSAFHESKAWADLERADGSFAEFRRLDAAFAREVEKRTGLKVEIAGAVERSPLETTGDVRLADTLVASPAAMVVIERGVVRFLDVDAALAHWKEKK